VGTHYYGAMCGGDRSGFEYLTGVEVASFEHLPRGLGRMRVPAQHYAVFRHPAGAVLGSTWQAIMAWLSGGRYESAHLPDFERYETAPESLSPQPNIELWVGVVDRGVR
jgi:predicted transcriptional regulator YdeE